MECKAPGEAVPSDPIHGDSDEREKVMLRDSGSMAFVHRPLRAQLNISIWSTFFPNLEVRTVSTPLARSTSFRSRRNGSDERIPVTASNARSVE